MLRGKQQRFVEEYLVDLNASQAALRAGYSPKSARIIGQQLLAKTYIAEAIQAAQAARSQRLQITQDNVLQELALLDFSSVADYEIDDFGNVKVCDSGRADALRAVSSLRKRITHHKDGSRTYDAEIRLWNKPAALRMSGQHTGTFKEHVELSGTLKVIRLPKKETSADDWHQSRNGHHVS